MHRLLQRQLRKIGLGGEPPADPHVWEQFLDRVTQSYAEFDKERYLLERSLLLSSSEMQDLSANLTAERDHLRVILSSISDGLCVLDQTGRLVLLNSSGGIHLGWTEGELLGSPVLPRIGLGYLPYAALVTSGRPFTDDAARLTRRDGSTFPSSLTLSQIGNGGGAVLMFRDITERQRREAMRLELVEEQAARALAEAAHRAAQSEIAERARVEAELAFQAAHDSLTGLPNRAYLRQKADQAITTARDCNGTAALLVMDLDRFKEINNTLGHQAGDALLHGVASRLVAAVRASDTVARLGGDEFAVLLPGTSRTAALQIANKLHDALELDIALEDQVVEVGASIGIASYPEDGADFSTLLRCADVAMYAAKRNGGGVALYAVEHDANSRERLSLVRDLREGIANNQLVLHYQPLVDLSTGEVSGVEALVRWAHPRLGLLSPDVFIPVAEQTGMVCALTGWVLTEALQQLRTWHAAGLAWSVSVNLSARSLQDRHAVPEVIRSTLAAAGLATQWLTVEITESMLMANPTTAREVLQELRSMGLGVAIDDFGTGYSSLAYLKELPLDVLKIDRSFVMDMGTDGRAAAIVRSAIELGHNLGLKIVAEGIECDSLETLLREWGCDFGQGYALSRPQPAAQLMEWMGTYTPRPTPGGRRPREAPIAVSGPPSVAAERRAA